ncbi:MAG: AbrB/MazE/SpoVT family DNA-binding domain-containing protein [Candidatus Njordarchaeum guaymaensis]
MNSIIKLKVGSKGEIFTTKEIRELIGLKPSSEVIAIVTKDGLLIKPKKSLKNFLRNCKTLLKINVEELEKFSEELQEEYYGL